MLKLGNTDINKIYLGSTEIEKAYLGSNLVYEKAPYILIPYTSWYRFEETSGTTVIDESGSNNGTNYGATIDQTGKVAKCYTYDGIDDYVSLANWMGLDVSNPFTIKVWYYAELGDTDNKWILGSSVYPITSGVNILKRSDNLIDIWLGNGTSNFGAGRKIFRFNSSGFSGWNQLVIQVNSINDVQLWANNVEKTFIDGGGSATSLGLPVSGSFILNSLDGSYYDLSIDELSSYNGVWTDEERQLIWDRESIGLPMT